MLLRVLEAWFGHNLRENGCEGYGLKTKNEYKMAQFIAKMQEVRHE